MKKILSSILVCFFMTTDLYAGESNENFSAGQVRAGLSWDNISAMETGELRFGGTAGIYVLNGLELGYEQLFVVPPEEDSQSRNYGYLRIVPFRSWPVNPFVSVQVGYIFMSDMDAISLGSSIGLVMFIDKHFAFEARFTGQGVFQTGRSTEQLADLDWRFVAYF